LLASIYSTYIIALGHHRIVFALHLHLHVLAHFLREKGQGVTFHQYNSIIITQGIALRRYLFVRSEKKKKTS